MIARAKNAPTMEMISLGTLHWSYNNIHCVNKGGDMNEKNRTKEGGPEAHPRQCSLPLTSGGQEYHPASFVAEQAVRAMSS